MVEDKYEEEEPLDDSEYSVKGDFSKATLIQNHLAKCLELRSRDMRPGYTTYVQGKPVIIPDSRKEFAGSIEALRNILSPELASKQPQINPQWETWKEKLFKRFAYPERKRKKFIIETDGVAVWEYTGKVFLPQKATSIKVSDPQHPNSIQTTFMVGAWDDKVDAYWDEMVLGCDELFAELNDLIHELDYFKGASSW